MLFSHRNVHLISDSPIVNSLLHSDLSFLDNLDHCNSHVKQTIFPECCQTSPGIQFDFKIPSVLSSQSLFMLLPRVSMTVIFFRRKLLSQASDFIFSASSHCVLIRLNKRSTCICYRFDLVQFNLIFLY